MRALAGAAVITSINTAADIVKEPIPIAKTVHPIPDAKAAKILQRGAGQYPWRELEDAGEDCSQYTHWILLQNRIPRERLSAMDPYSAKLQFETVDSTPAPDSLGYMVNKASVTNHYIH